MDLVGRYEKTISKMSISVKGGQTRGTKITKESENGGASTHSVMFAGVPIPTSRKYPTAYMAFTKPRSAAFCAQRNASVSDWGKTPGEPTRYQAVNAKQASR